MITEVIGSSRVLEPHRLLSQVMCLTRRISGAPIAPDNFGVIDQYNQLLIPVGNVGTMLIFPKAIKDYEYIDVTVQGFNPIILAFGTTEHWHVIGGTEGVDAGQQVFRIPNIGDITFLVFQQSGFYTVTDITAYKGSTPYYKQEQNLDIFGLVPFGGMSFNSDTGVLSKEVAASGSEIFRLESNLIAGIRTGKLGVWLTASAPFPEQNVLFFDGMYTQTLKMLGAKYLYFDSNDSSVYIQFDNTAAIPVTINFHPIVNFWQPISTTYGADPDSDDGVSGDNSNVVVANWFVDSVNGDDDNSGDSSLFPFRSLAAAAAVVTNDEVVALRRGSLFEESWNQRTGPTGVTLRNYGPTTEKLPVISSRVLVTAGSWTFTPGDTFFLMPIFYPGFGVSYTGYTSIYEDEHQLILTSTDTGNPGTYYIVSVVGSLVTYKVYPYSGDNGTIGADPTGRVFTLGLWPICVGMNDGCRLLGIHCKGNTGTAGCVVAGVNTVISNCLIEEFINCGVCQHSGVFSGNVVHKPTISALENAAGFPVMYASTRALQVYDLTVVSSIYDTVPLSVSGNQFITGYPTSFIDSKTLKGIYLTGNAQATSIVSNAFTNLKVIADFSDTGGSPGLTFSNNAIYNWGLGLVIRGPYLVCSGNLFFLDPADLSFTPIRLFQVLGTGSDITVQNNKIMTTSANECTFRIDTASILRILNNTIWCYSAGNAGAAPMLRCTNLPTLQVRYNIFAEFNKILLTTSGAAIPTVGASNWDHNGYVGINQYTQMFKFGILVFDSIVDWIAGTVLDAHSVHGTYSYTPKALLGDLTPVELGTAFITDQGVDDYSLSTYLRSISPLDISSL